MKFTILIAGLLGVFLAPALADYNINISDEGNSVGSGQQSVSVNNEHNVANVDNNNGWDSWNSIWDYGTGFAATRLFAKKLCIVHEINKEAVPPIHVLDALVKEKKLQGKGPGGPPPKSLVYSVNPNQVDDLNKFGKSITNMCRKIPTYLAEEIRGGNSCLKDLPGYPRFLPPGAGTRTCLAEPGSCQHFRSGSCCCATSKRLGSDTKTWILKRGLHDGQNIDSRKLHLALGLTDTQIFKQVT
ncbi:gastrokine-1 [Loxodonta africana]|uniref:gastrokine-1 n=1 Tax=Loxodonta africana TaxID=9785 RepID=UPI0030D42A05